jgi:hypothetical protein
MKSQLKTLLALIILFVPSAGESVNMQFTGDESARLKVFYHDEDAIGWDAVLKGKVISISMREGSGVNEISASASDRSMVTVRLYGHEGIKSGDELFCYQ